MLCRGSTCGLRHDVAERLDDTRVELRARRLAQLRHPLLGVERVAVGARGRHRVIGVADGDDAGADRDRLARQGVRISMSVPALVTGAHHLGHRDERGRRAQDPLADDGVLVDERPLALVERARLVQDRVRDRHLSDVVQLRGANRLVELLGQQLQALADPARQLSDGRHVLAQLGVSLAQRLQQDVARLPAGGGSALLLLRVHALVGDLERQRGVPRLLGIITAP